MTIIKAVQQSENGLLHNMCFLSNFSLAYYLHEANLMHLNDVLRCEIMNRAVMLLHAV